MDGFSVGDTVNSFADWICRAPLIRGIVSNAFLTALLITALTAVIILSMYRVQMRTGGLKKKVRAFLYVFLVVIVFAFLHHYCVTSMMRDSIAKDGVREVFAGIEHSRTIGGSTPPEMPSAVEGGDCGCGDEPLPSRVEAAARAIGAHRDNIRRDNIRLDDDLVLEDVVLASRPMR
jgi:hypothetical protein